MNVKICGITNLEDALAAQRAGADMLGFNFHPGSPRYIEPRACAAIITALRGSGITLAGVFVNAAPEQVEAIMSACGLDLAQLSGDEPPEDLAALQRLGVPFVKALRPVDSRALRDLLAHYPLPHRPPACLLDASVVGAYGGTGVTADWNLAAGLAARLLILLAGGLRVDNVGEAIRQVQPWGVDVASGVEIAPGRKDAGLMAEFVWAAKETGKGL